MRYLPRLIGLLGLPILSFVLILAAVIALRAPRSGVKGRISKEVAPIPAPVPALISPSDGEPPVLPVPVYPVESSQEAAPDPATESLTELQKSVIGSEDRIVGDREALFQLKAVMGDPLAEMEKELRLTPSQKDVIRQHTEDRSTEYSQLLNAGLKERDRKSFDTQYRSVIERYDRRILNELDSGQAEKYRALKRAGRFIVIFPAEVHRTP